MQLWMRAGFHNRPGVLHALSIEFINHRLDHAISSRHGHYPVVVGFASDFLKMPVVVEFYNVFLLHYPMLINLFLIPCKFTVFTRKN